jgi:hypothetical protein
MLSPTVRVATILCGIAVAMLVMPVGSAIGFCGLFHHDAAPAVAVAPVMAAPACASCATPTYAAAPACATCAPQTCGYMPTVVYRALYQPAVVTAYQPVYQPVYRAAYAPATYAVTTYRPPFAWAYQGSLVPYTTYRPLYAAMPVVAYSGCDSCASSGSTCAGYSSCSSCSSCSSGTCGAVTYEAPASSCSSCVAPATVVAPAASCPSCAAPAVTAPAPINEVPPAANVAPKTFQEKTEKPELKPQPDAHFNSTPSPLLPDPTDRTALRTSSSTVRLVASPVQVTPAADDGWQPARD